MRRGGKQAAPLAGLNTDDIDMRESHARNKDEFIFTSIDCYSEHGLTANLFCSAE